jgi:hypothetical protein
MFVSLIKELQLQPHLDLLFPIITAKDKERLAEVPHWLDAG